MKQDGGADHAVALFWRRRPTQRPTFHYVHLILSRSGAVEANPGPMPSDQANDFDGMLQLLQVVNARFITFDQGQACLIEFVQEIKDKYNSTEI